jgi:subtilisin family serine protease
MVKRQSWQHVLGALVLGAMLWALAAAPAGANGGPNPGGTIDAVTPGQVILKLQNPADLPALAAQYQLYPTPIDQLSIEPLYLMRITDGVAPEIRAAALSADSRVGYAEADVIGSSAEDEAASSWASGGGAATYLGQWAPAVMHLSRAFSVTRGAGVTVAVLDTGVDFTHPALAGHLIGGYDFVDNDADPSEVGLVGINRAYGHGTFVTGLVALAAPQARIMPVRVLDPNGLSDVWRLAKAMVWATSNGADVINLSLGTFTRTHIANELIANITLTGRGVVVVAAAGNAGSNVPQFPAAEGGARVLSVGASTPIDTLALFSDYGSWVRVAAPGVSVWSTVPGGQFAAWNGTSMATGLAAGEAALVRATYPTLNAQNVITRIASTSTKISGAVPLRIDAGASVGAS